MFSAKSTFLYLGLLFTGSYAARSQSQVNFKPENSLYNSLNFIAPPVAGDSIQFNKKRIRLV
ncbi:MAG: hypothetical protein ABI168_12865, partial [Ginsengibacter sp.]